ncbi:hypothetical protein [Anaerovibrio sp.]|uniref:hypothetical protein n=1 Tax=Anaerovibrio sp. TaxID=1872532 RepID=UPI003F13D2E8
MIIGKAFTAPVHYVVVCELSGGNGFADLAGINYDRGCKKHTCLIEDAGSYVPLDSKE